jgi:hypothetical protein
MDRPLKVERDVGLTPLVNMRRALADRACETRREGTLDGADLTTRVA